MAGEAGFWRSDARLLAAMDATLAEAASRAGDWLVCRPGCTSCCIGPFPITSLDAARLARGLERLTAVDPASASRVRARAESAVAAMSDGFPGNASRGVLPEDESARDRSFARHEALPCPALDPGSGRCDLFGERPISCRTFGPPVRIGAEMLPPCELCFRGASVETVEACRVEFDGSGEARLLGRLAADRAPEEETVVAFALVIPGGFHGTR
jgi:Fe-S-cluster containining protein